MPFQSNGMIDRRITMTVCVGTFFFAFLGAGMMREIAGARKLKSP